MNATEVKVKAAAVAALAVSLAGTALLTNFDVAILPDWAEVIGYSLVNAGLVWLAGFRTRNVAGKLSPSTIEAVEAELHRRMNKTLG